jgi:serine/threonine-protein kinase ATR
MQALSAWLCFVQLLARHAPKVLERIAAQAAVVLLPVLEPADSQVGWRLQGTICVVLVIVSPKSTPSYWAVV